MSSEGPAAEALHLPAWDVTGLLYAQHRASIAGVWYIMGGVGFVSAVGIWLYGRSVQQRRAAVARAGTA